MDQAGVSSTIVISLSMGAYTGLRLAIEHSDRVTALVAASGGAGSPPEGLKVFQEEAFALSETYLAEGKMLADNFANGPTRSQLKRKDIRGWTEFRDQLAEHPAFGAAYTLRHVQGRRSSLYDFEAAFEACDVPTLLLVGDENDVCLSVNVWLKRHMPTAGLRAVYAGLWPVRARFDGEYAGIGPR